MIQLKYEHCSKIITSLILIRKELKQPSWRTTGKCRCGVMMGLPPWRSQTHREVLCGEGTLLSNRKPGAQNELLSLALS